RARPEDASFGFRASSLIRHSSFELRHSSSQLRFLDQITANLSLGAPGKLTRENRWRAGGDELVTLEDKLRINGVAGGLVNLVAAEVTVEFVFVIIIAPEIEALPIRSQLLLFIQHY